MSQTPQPSVKPNWFSRHKLLTTVGAVIVVIIVAAAIGEGGEGDSASTDHTSSAPVSAASDADSSPEGEEPTEVQEPIEPAQAGIGDEATDGKFTFVITQVEPGVMSIGNDPLITEPQGQFVLVYVTVTNSGDQAQYFLPGSQSAMDTQGRTHSSDSAAGLYLDASTWAGQINPGNTMNGVVVFDIPTDATLASIDLHDSLLSGGVTVTLG